MIKETILELINNDFINTGKIYFSNNIPIQISNAIYSFGSNDISNIIVFIDNSDNLDGSIGYIFTDNKLYSNLGSFSYDQITKLELEKHHNNPKISAYITTKDNKYCFDNKHFNSETLLKLFSKITDLNIDVILNDHEKVAYYVSIVLNDLLNDEYEDIELTTQLKNKINSFLHDLELIEKLDDSQYNDELEQLCLHALNFFDELELDSEEIDILIELKKDFDNKKYRNSQQVNESKKYYDDLMNKYLNGDPNTINQMKNVMKNLGLDENSLKDKSPDEINQYIDNLCNSFGISRQQVDNLAKKFNFK